MSSNQSLHGAPCAGVARRITTIPLVLSCALWLSGGVTAQPTTAAPLPGDSALAPLAGAQWEPQLSAGAGAYLAVWSDERGALVPTFELDPWEVVQSDIYAARLGPDGVPLDAAPIRVDGSAYSQVTPHAASNGTDWLVAYESRSVSSTGFFTTQDIRAVRISGAGVPLDDTPLLIDVNDDDDYVPAVASDGVDWAVFWRDSGGIVGRKVDADGSLHAVIPVSAGAGWTFDPEACFAGDRYLVVWDGTGVMGRFFDTNLQPLGAPFLISIAGGDPSIATDGTDFYVTLSDLGTWAEIRGTVVTSSGTVLNPEGLLLDANSFLALTPATVSWDGSGYLVSWLEWKFSFPDGPEYTVRTNRTDAAGVPLFADPPIVIQSTAFSVGDPVVASLGAGDSVLGWLDSRFGSQGGWVGYATVVDSAGTTMPEQPFMVAPPAQLSPELVAGPVGATLEDDVLLAVFLSADAAETRVVYQRLDGLGTPLDPEPIVIAGGSNTYTAPAAAWNGNLWLVTWEDTLGGTGNGGVLAVRLLPDGTLLDAQPFDVMEGNEPAVAALAVSGSDFLVAASHITSGDISTMYERRVSADGTLLDGSKVFLGFDYAVAATVAGFDDRWLVSWYKRPTHDTPSSTLRARFVLSDGTVQPNFDPTNSTNDELDPDLAIAGDVATLAWSDGTDIRVRRIQKDGTALGSAAGVVVSSAENEQSHPTVAVDGSKTVVSWVDDRGQGIFEPGMGDLYGARLDSALNVIEAEGVGLAIDPTAPDASTGSLGRLGTTVLLQPSMLTSTGNWKISVSSWTDWTDLGGGLAGTHGEPSLTGMGLLISGEVLELDVTGGLENSALWLVTGLTELSAPFKGGTLVPSPDLLLPLATDASGSLSLDLPIGSGFPSGLDLFVQAWIVDSTGPAGWAATQGVQGTVP